MSNVIKPEHNQSKVMDRFKLVRLEITVEANGHEHVRQIQTESKRQVSEIIKVYPSTVHQIGGSSFRL